ncbi:MAG: ABC transporter substrate-binding protein [bacterium]
MRKFICNLCLPMLLLLLIIILFNNSSKEALVVQQSKKITIVDSMQRRVEVPSPPQRVVVLNGDVGELICVLGCEKNIVGTSDTINFPLALKDKPKVGRSFTPNIERILALKPDVIFGYGGFLKPDLLKQIEQTGIPVVLLDCFKLKTFNQDTLILGQIFNEEKRAQEYLDYMDNYLNLITRRISQVPLSERQRVFLEAYSDYGTVRNIGAAEMLQAAGGINVAQSLNQVYPKVSSEWIIQENPDVIVKGVSKVPSGYGIENTGFVSEHRRIVSRPGWEKIAAVKNDRVYLLSCDIWTGAREVIGIAYMAKWLYPQLFQDLHPEKIHADVLQRFHHVTLKGTWVYPDR